MKRVFCNSSEVSELMHEEVFYGDVNIIGKLVRGKKVGIFMMRGESAAICGATRHETEICLELDGKKFVKYFTFDAEIKLI